MKIFLKKNISLFFIVAIAFLAAYPASCRWFNFLLKPLSEKAIILFCTWFIFTIIAWLLNRKFQFAKIPSSSTRRTWIGAAGAMSMSLIILWIFNWQPPAFPSNYRLEIIPEGNVQLLRAKSGGELLALDQFTSSSGWQLTEKGWSDSGSGADVIRFAGAANAPFELAFATGADAGRVAINLNGTTTQLNLAAPMPDTAFYRPLAASLGSPSAIWIFWVGLLAISEWLLLAGFIHFLFSRWAAGTAAFVFPLGFLLPYITTFAGHNVTIGNDFGPFYYVYKSYLLDFLASGHFPLWSPSEAAGYPFFSNPLVQALYPPNILLTIIYWLNQGYTRLDHQVYTVLAVSWFSLGLYLWLRSLNIEKRFALLAALTLALSYKVTELLRFPNALHEAAWYPWILLSLTGLFIATDRKSTLRWSAALFACLVCLFTAGYPYFIYYLPFLVVPYLLFMLIPQVRSILFSIEKPGWLRFLSSAFSATALALLACAPYLYQMIRTINQTAGRAGGDFEHAIMYPFDFQDAIQSLLYPPASFFEGWFYFGALALLLIILFLAHPQYDTSHPENPLLAKRRSWPVKVAILAWLIFISYLSLGEQSYLFLLFYKILPEFSALRSWGRLSIALLAGLALLLAYALADFESRLVSITKTNAAAKTWAYIAILAVTSLSLVYQLTAIHNGLTDQGWNTFLIPRNAYLIQTIANTLGQDIQPDQALLSYWFKLAYSFFTVIAALLTGVMIYKLKLKSGSAAHWLMYIGLGIFSAANLWFGGAWMWNNGFHPEETRQPHQYQHMLSISLSTPRKNEDSTLTLSPSFSVGSPPKWHYGRYQEFYTLAAAEGSARDELLGVTDGRRFFFSTAINYENIAGFLADAHQFDIKPVVHDYSGDHLLLEVTVPQTGYFTFVDNWDEDWRATVDGKPVKIEPLFGVFKSVALEAGRHEINMSYCPRFFEWANSGCSTTQP